MTDMPNRGDFKMKTGTKLEPGMKDIKGYPVNFITHGTSSGFVRGCRCGSCITARRKYQREWNKKRTPGHRRVSPKKTKAHIKKLKADGVALKEIERMTGYPSFKLSWILNDTLGPDGRPRVKYILESTEKRILDVDYGSKLKWSRIDGKEFKRLHSELLASGLKTKEIAALFYGNHLHSNIQQMSREKVALESFKKMKRIHDQLWWRSPDLRLVCRCDSRLIENRETLIPNPELQGGVRGTDVSLRQESTR